MLDNATREKTIEQKGREAKTLLEVEKVKANERQSLLNGKNQLSAELHIAEERATEKGRATDITAQKVGLKTGREVERAIKTVEVIDELYLAIVPEPTLASFASSLSVCISVDFRFSPFGEELLLPLPYNFPASSCFFCLLSYLIFIFFNYCNSLYW